LDREGGEFDEYDDSEFLDNEFTDDEFGDEFDTMDEGGTPTAPDGQLLTRPQHEGDATPDSTGTAPAVTDSIAADSAATLPADTLHTPPDSIGQPDSLADTTVMPQDTAAMPDTPANIEQAITDSTTLATHLERVEAVPLSTQLGHDALA